MKLPENALPIWDRQHNLGNFGSIPVVIRGGRNYFPTSEHLYQMAKFKPEFDHIRQLIQNTSDPLDAKKIARDHSTDIRSDWDTLRFRVMEGIIRLKFRQHPELQQELLATGDRYIYEDADKFAKENPTKEEIAEMRRWGLYKGDGKEYEGENQIGVILMKIRKELRKNIDSHTS